MTGLDSDTKSVSLCRAEDNHRLGNRQQTSRPTPAHWSGSGSIKVSPAAASMPSNDLRPAESGFLKHKMEFLAWFKSHPRNTYLATTVAVAAILSCIGAGMGYG